MASHRFERCDGDAHGGPGYHLSHPSHPSRDCYMAQYPPELIGDPVKLAEWIARRFNADGVSDVLSVELVGGTNIQVTWRGGHANRLQRR